MDMPVNLVVLAATVTGLLFHAVYNRYEPTLPNFFRNLILLIGAFACGANYLFQDLFSTLQGTALFSVVHLAALSLSVAAYRLFFHPLRKFPGPWAAKLTKWTSLYHSSTGFLHVWLPAQHAKYGDIVRVGPNELSFSSAGAVKYLHGPQGARLTKGPYYDTHVFSTGGKSMPGTRDWEDHRIRRRIWDHGFSQKSLKSYEPRLLGLLDVLCNELERLEGQTVDFAAWCDYFAFDAMGDLAFNTSFGLMTADGPRNYSNFVRTGIKMFHILANVPWISPIAYILPVSNSMKEEAYKFKVLGSKQYRERRAQGTEPNDLFSHLIAGNKNGQVTSEIDLEADVPTLFIAGSDTTAIALTFLFYFLTRDKGIYERLRDEIDKTWDGKSLLEGNMLGPETCPYLNGAIYESMRVMPPGPNGMQRRTGKGGHTVNGTFIPEYTQVSSNTITLAHDPTNFTEPLSFIPDRWNDSLRDPTWNHDVRAFLPFTGGTFSCAGRALAMVEMRLFCASLMRRFDVLMPEGFDHDAFMGGVRSYQSLFKKPLPLIIKARRLSSAKEKLVDI